MSDWQPIATAKNDGRSVLVWWPAMDDEPMIAWQKDLQWRSDGVMFYTIGPTHWMPLPAPPTADDPR